MQRMKRVLALFLAVATVWTGMPLDAVLAQDNVTEQSVENVTEQTVLEEVEAEETTPEQSVQEEALQEIPEETQATIAVNYVVVDSNYITSPGTQKIVVGIGNDDTVIENAVLTYVNEETQEQYTAQEIQSVGGAVLFSVDFAEGQSGVYSLKQIEYTVGGTIYTGEFSAMGLETKFGVDKEVETQPDAEIVDENEEETPIVITDIEGNEITEVSIEDAIDSVVKEKDNLQEDENIKAKTYANNGTLVVVLDPGHGGSDPGVVRTVNGVSYIERDINLKIAQYCKAELEQYAGIKVYLTRTDNTSKLMDRKERTNYAMSVGADVIVSIHINSTGSETTTANGAQVYCPNNDTQSGRISQELADRVLNHLVALGLHNRGKVVDESLGMIKYPKEKGVPGILIEHAFINNQGDRQNYLSTDEQLKRLGVADATGIAQYYGLQKKTALQLNGIFCVDKGERLEAGVDYQTTAQFVAFRWMAYNTNNGMWELLSDWSAADYISWKPGKGTYWLRVDAISSDGVQRECTTVYSSKRDYTRNFLNIKGIYQVSGKESISSAVSYETNDSALEFRWMEYSVSKGTWRILSDWSSKESIQWKPEKGSYWLRVEARTSDGVEEEYTLAYNSGRDYTHNYIELKGIYQVAGEDSISSAVSYETNDSAPKFRWMEYSVSKGTWKVLSDWGDAESIEWRPEAGPYWLRVEAKTSDGVEEEYTLAYNVTRDYTCTYIHIKGIYQIESSDAISSAVSYETNDTTMKFRWMEYSVSKGTWRILSDWSNKESIQWKPEAGAYWLRVEARTSEGVEKEYTLAYNSTRDYTHNYVEIQGIYYKENYDGIEAGAVHQTNDNNTEFRWLVYDANSGVWNVISDWKKNEWVTWKPEDGNYWLRVEARTSDGKESNCTIVYNVEKYRIMGASNTTLQQMVTYYKSKATYPSFYVGSDAPNIETFCKIYLEECAAEGVKAEVAFCQAMKETGFLRFTGRVPITAYNFGGLGAIDSDVNAWASFSSVREGIRAQVQHLKAYASTESLNQVCVDPRFSLVKRGSAPYVEWLGQKENPYGYGWATAERYGYSIRTDYMNKLLSY